MPFTEVIYSKLDASQITKRLFSEINNCQPFVTQRFSSSYKEEGYYSDGTSLLTDSQWEIMNKTQIYYCICVVVKGDQITPLF